MKNIITDHRILGLQLFQLAWADVRRTYRGAALGWMWALIKPATMITVYWFVLGKGLRASPNIEGVGYFSWLIVGILPWFYVRDMLSAGTSAFKKYSYLVNKIKFPVSTIATIVNVSNLLTHLVLIVIIGVIVILTGDLGSPAYLLQLPFYILLSFIFLSLWALFSGPLAAISKDWSNLVGALTQVLFWISGILYSIDQIDTSWIRAVLKANPITYLVEGYRNSLIGNVWFWEDISSLVVFTAGLLILAILSVRTFSKTKSAMADNL